MAIYITSIDAAIRKNGAAVVEWRGSVYGQRLAFGYPANEDSPQMREHLAQVVRNACEAKRREAAWRTSRPRKKAA